MNILSNNLTINSNKLFNLIKKDNKKDNKKDYKTKCIINKNKLIKKIYKIMKKTYKSEYKSEYKYNKISFNYNNYSHLLNYIFVAENIKLNIKKTIKSVFIIKYKNININLFCKYKTKNKTVSKIISNILNIILICCEYFNNKNEIIINLFLSSIKKVFNNNKILGPENSNSGFTHYPNGIYENGEIVIFREEEYQKVLFHECIHAFRIDMKLWNNNLNEKVYNTYCLDINEKNKININETYVEFLASLFNQIFIIISLNLKLSLINKIFEYEKIYSLSKSYQILKHYKYNIKNIFRSEKCNTFNQKTSILSYYIFKTALQFNTKKIFDFYLKDNYDIYKFNDLIKKSMSIFIKNNVFKENNSIMFYGKTLRMTLFSIK